MKERKFLDVSKGAAEYLGLTGEEFFERVRQMEKSGYIPEDIEVVQESTGRVTRLKVLVKSAT